MSARFCPENVQIANNYFLNPFRWACSFIIIAGMYHFYKAYKKGELGGESKRSFVLVMMYFALTANTVFFHSLFLITVCREPFETWRPIHIVFNIGAATSMAWSCCFFYWRLYNVFKGTAFAMGKWTQRITTVILVWIVFQGMASALITSFHYIPFIVTVVSFAFKIIIGFAFWMAFMFIYKLRQIHVFMSAGDISANDQEFRNVATKTTLLWTINISITLLLNSINVVAVNRERESTRIIVNFLTPLFVFTDFLAVFLSYNRFDGFYRTLLGSCHNCCLWMWEKKSPIEHKLAQVASGTSKDTTTDGTRDTTATTGDKSTVLSVDSAMTDQSTVQQSVGTSAEPEIEITTQ